MAEAYDQMECLQYAHEHGCPRYVSEPGESDDDDGYDAHNASGWNAHLLVHFNTHPRR